MDKYKNLSFAEFIKARAFSLEDPASDNWLKQFSEHIFNTETTHNGDCTNKSYTCNLCLMESLLQEYRLYIFDFQKWLREYESPA